MRNINYLIQQQLEEIKQLLPWTTEETESDDFIIRQQQPFVSLFPLQAEYCFIM